MYTKSALNMHSCVQSSTFMTNTQLTVLVTVLQHLWFENHAFVYLIQWLDHKKSRWFLRLVIYRKYVFFKWSTYCNESGTKVLCPVCANHPYLVWRLQRHCREVFCLVCRPADRGNTLHVSDTGDMMWGVKNECVCERKEKGTVSMLDIDICVCWCVSM